MEDDKRRRDGYILNRFGTPEDVAAAILYLVSDSGCFLTGQTIHVNGGHYLPWPSKSISVISKAVWSTATGSVTSSPVFTDFDGRVETGDACQGDDLYRDLVTGGGDGSAIWFCKADKDAPWISECGVDRDVLEGQSLHGQVRHLDGDVHQRAPDEPPPPLPRPGAHRRGLRPQRADGDARPLIPEAEDPGHYYRVWDSSDDPARHRTKIRFGKFRAGAPTSLG